MATAPDMTDSIDLLAQIAQMQGDISSLFDEQTLTTIGADVVRDFERDLSDREKWEMQARKGLKRAAQEKEKYPDAPPYRRSHINFPILTQAAQQFNARAYPAICKSGNMVRCKIIGSDKGRPRVEMTPAGPIPIVTLNGQPMLLPEAQQAAQVMQAQQPPANDQDPSAQQAPAPQIQPIWDIPPGFKAKRADRVSDYMNVVLEFRMDDWEEDTDLLLTQLPIIGCGFRKLWWHDGKQCAAYVSALDLVVPSAAKSLKTTPRISEILPPTFPYQIRERINAGEYRAVELPSSSEDDEAARELIEQHRLMDLDEDGVDEPYIITVDKETSKVLRIVANFSVDDVHMGQDGSVKRIEREQFYVKYPFLPDPNGGFYDIGFAHLIEQISDAINAAIDQTLDAAHAQIAGGGFIAGGLRLQGNGQTNQLRWLPGEYKMVNAPAGALKDAIYERTFPEPSPVIFNLLELMLGAAKDITSVKDVVTGEAPNTAPVGTTLALIQQGLSVFTAIIKRVYRSLGTEFGMIYRSLGRYGGEEMAEDYMNVLDDPEADFAKDFAEADMDIKPVADPTAITNMQKIAKAGLLDSMRGKGLNDQEINKRVLEAADIEDIDKLLPPENAPPDPMIVAELQAKTSQADLNTARAAEAQARAAEAGVNIGKTLAGAE